MWVPARLVVMIPQQILDFLQLFSFGLGLLKAVYQLSFPSALVVTKMPTKPLAEQHASFGDLVLT